MYQKDISRSSTRQIFPTMDNQPHFSVLQKLLSPPWSDFAKNPTFRFIWKPEGWIGFTHGLLTVSDWLIEYRGKISETMLNQ
jgi:hypothetical protein